MSEATENSLMPIDEMMRNELEPLINASFKAARDSFDPNAPMAWLPQWYLGELAALKAAKDVLTVQYNKMLAQIAAREKALDWKWGRDFQAQVQRDLDVQPGKKRSVDYLTGRAGFRKSGGGAKLLVSNEVRALNAAHDAYPELLSEKLDRKAVKQHLEQGGELPGATLVQTDAKNNFFPSVTQPLLEQGDTDDANGQD